MDNMDNVVASKVYDRDEFYKSFISYFKSEYKGVFKYFNIYNDKDRVRTSIHVKADKEEPDFITAFNNDRSIKIKKGKTHSLNLEEIAFLAGKFANFETDKIFCVSDKVYLIGKSSMAISEANKLKEKAKNDEEELKELIEGALHLSDNPEEIKYIELIAKSLFN